MSSKKRPYWERLPIGNLLRGDDIKDKARRGSVALSIGAFFERALRLVRVIVLARLLVPEDFGIIAIIMMVVIMSETITDAGVRLSIIQNKEGAKFSYLNAAWWFQTIRGFGLFLVSFLFAPHVAAFYDNPILTDLLRVAFLSILLNGLVSPRVHLLEREFRFGKWALLFQVSALLGTIVIIILAFYLHNVWAIILGTVIERSLYCLFSHIMYPFRPSFEVDKNSISELFKFAKGIFGLSILNLIARQADVFVLSKVVTSATLGSYYLALQLAEQIGYLFSSMILPVLLPSFVAMRENKGALKNALLSVNRGIAMLGIPIATFIAANSAGILSILYGSQYTDAGMALMILSLTMFIRAQAVVLGQIDIGLGRPYLVRRQSLKRAVIIVTLMYPATKFAGLSGAAFVMLLANTAMLFFQLNSVKTILQLRPIVFFSKWIIGVGLGMLIMIPNFILFVFNVDSFMFQSVFSIGMMIIVIIFGFNKLLRQATL